MGVISLLLWLRALTLIRNVSAGCLPETTFQSPSYDSSSLTDTFNSITGTINQSITKGDFQNVSLSLEIASSTQTLFSFYHTADSFNNGTKNVTGTTSYRIASNTKLFTALGILRQQEAGNLSLDDPIGKYVSDLRVNTNIEWTKITIRSLMAHMGGVPDNYAEDDVYLTLQDPEAYGLPPISSAEHASLPTCEGFSNFTSACTEQELMQYLQTATPVAPPNTLSSYSNIGYDLLGLVLSNVTGMQYEEYISTSITQPLGMESTSFNVPDVADSVVPEGGYFGIDLGVGNPSGGLYSTSTDMIKFLQNALTTSNNITSAMNWFQPATYGPGSHSLIGYPWEIFRSAGLLPNSSRAVTVNTKGGGLQGFYSYSIVMPVYDLVAFMSVGGDNSALPDLNIVFDTVLETLIPAAEAIAQSQLAQNYSGTYTAAATANSTLSLSTDDPSYNPSLNSSITLSQSASQSLYIDAWMSNGTDTLAAVKQLAGNQAGQDATAIHFQFLPMFESRTRGNGNGTAYGEVWRFINVLEDDSTSPWDDYCVSVLDPLSYAEQPINEAVFWRDGEDGEVLEIEMTAFSIRMARM